MPRLTACLAIALVFAANLRAAEAPAPLTEAAARAFAEKLQASIVEDKPELFDTAFDPDGFGERALHGLNPPKDFLAGTLEGFKQGFRKYGSHFAQQVDSASGFKLIQIKPVGTSYHAVFRIRTHTGRLNYLEYLLILKSGEPRILDFYPYNCGEWFSETTRRLLLPKILAIQARDKQQEVLDSKAADNIKILYEISVARNEGNYELALELYGRLDESTRKQRVALVQRAGAARLVDMQEYLKAVADFEKEFPDDPALDLVSLDANISRKHWAAAHQCLDRLATRVGPDAYLDFLHANVYWLEEKYPAALAAAEKAIAAEPALQDPYFTLIAVALKQQDHAATAKALARFEKKFGRIEFDLEKIPAYAGFLKSPDFAAWQKARPTPDAAPPDAAPQPVKPNE